MSSIADLPLLPGATQASDVVMVGRGPAAFSLPVGQLVLPGEQLTIAQLRANTAVLPVVYVLGYYATADGGEGLFICASADTTSADNGGTIIVDAAGHRFYRAGARGEVDPRWFGARGDGVTSDSAAFQAALTWLKAIGGGTLRARGGIFLQTFTLVGSTNVNLLSDLANFSIIKRSTDYGDTIVVGDPVLGGGGSCRIEGWWFNHGDEPVASTTQLDAPIAQQSAHVRIYGGQSVFIEGNIFWRLTYGVAFHGSSIVHVRGNSFVGVWDNNQLGLQEGIANVLFGVGLGFNTIAHVEKNYCSGLLGASGDLIYTDGIGNTAVVRGATFKIGAQHSILVQSLESGDIDANFFGGATKHAVSLSPSVVGAAVSDIGITANIFSDTGAPSWSAWCATTAGSTVLANVTRTDQLAVGTGVFVAGGAGGTVVSATVVSVVGSTVTLNTAMGTTATGVAVALNAAPPSDSAHILVASPDGSYVLGLDVSGNTFNGENRTLYALAVVTAASLATDPPVVTNLTCSANVMFAFVAAPVLLFGVRGGVVGDNQISNYNCLNVSPPTGGNVTFFSAVFVGNACYGVTVQANGLGGGSNVVYPLLLNYCYLGVSIATASATTCWQADNINNGIITYFSPQQVATSIEPVVDNSITVGDFSKRFASIWAANGVIQTSDPSLKTDIADLPDMLPVLMALSPKTYRWIEGGKAVEPDGTVTSSPGVRTHWGFLAGDVFQAFRATERDFAGYVQAEDGTEMLRPDQLTPALWKAVQELAARVEASDARAAALGAKLDALLVSGLTDPVV